MADKTYYRVRVTGEFEHDKELYIVPRHKITADDREPLGLFGYNTKDHGAFVVTPFKVKGRDYSILVNRGWVHKSMIDPAKRPKGQVSGEITISGLVNRTETVSKQSYV